MYINKIARELRKMAMSSITSISNMFISFVLRKQVLILYYALRLLEVDNN